MAIDMTYVELDEIVIAAFFMICLMAIGFVLGLYTASQIDKHVKKRTNGN